MIKHVKTHISRRHILRGAGAIAAGAAGVFTNFGKAPAYAKGKRRLRMVTTWPKNFPGLGTSVEHMARQIRLISEGQLDIRVYAAGEFVGAFEAFDAVSTGTADMYNGAEYYWQGKSPAFNFFTSVPFGLTANELAAWLNFGGGQELWETLSARFNIRAFQSANTGVQAGGWFRSEIKTLDDFRGLKMRIPGLGGEVLRRLGVAAVALPGSEIFPAMRSGAIDASEWVGPWNDLAFGFHQLARYYYSPGFHEPGAGLATGINLNVWNELSKPHQALIRTVCAAENERILSEFNYKNSVALKTLLDRHRIQMRQFSPEIMASLKRISHEVMTEIAASDDFTAQVYQSQQNAAKLLAGWEDASTAPYIIARRGA